jgi:hypothetical protein
MTRSSKTLWSNFLWYEAADHILSCEGRFWGEADKQGRVASTAWVEDDPICDIIAQFLL